MDTHDDVELSTKLCTKWCGDYIPLNRFNHGFKTCYSCGEKEAKHLTSLFTVVPMHKSNYMLITNLDDLKGLNNKGGIIK